jgi:hypothetical protein
MMAGTADASEGDRSPNGGEVGANKAKTASRRIVPICDTLAVWLAPYAGRQGMVWPRNSATISRAQWQTAAGAGMKWKHNALRHSYANHRFAKIGDAGRVTGELGNSAAVVHRHRELVAASHAQAWFAAMPSAPANDAAIGAYPANTTARNLGAPFLESEVEMKTRMKFMRPSLFGAAGTRCPSTLASGQRTQRDFFVRFSACIRITN